MAAPRAGPRATLAIAANTFAGIMRNKAIYLAFFLIALLMGLMILPIIGMRMAAEAGEMEMAEAIQQQMVVGIFGTWGFATYVLAMFLGATALSAEVKAGTIVTVLAKPIERWLFLVGKWLGMQVFLVLFLACGMLMTVLALSLVELEPAPVFWVAVARSFVLAAIFAGASLLVSVVSSPVFAGGLTFVAAVLNSMVVANLVDSAAVWLRLPARLLYLVAPAPMPDNLLAASFGSYILAPQYGLYAQVLAENVLYAGALLLIACWMFTHREIRLR